MPKASAPWGSALSLYGLLILLPWLPIIIPLVVWFRFLLWLESLLGRRLAGSLVLVGVWALTITGVLLALVLTDSDLALRTAIVSTLLLVFVLVPLTGLYFLLWLESLLGRRLAGSLVLVGVWALAILSVLLALTYPHSDLALRTAVLSTLLLVFVLVPLTGLYAAHWLARSTEDPATKNQT